MTPINKNDITIRMQLAACCVATKLSKLVKNLKYGNDLSCIDDQFRELARLNKYIEILGCYKVEGPEVPATLTYSYVDWTDNGGFKNYTLNLNSNTIEIPTVGAGGQSGSYIDAIAALVIQVNTSLDYMTVVNDTVNKTLTFTAPSGFGTTPNDNWNLNFTTAGTNPPNIPTSTTSNFSGGLDITTDLEITNCLSHDQILKIFNDISDICNICFEPLGFTYPEEEGSINLGLITEQLENFIDQQGNYLITEN